VLGLRCGVVDHITVRSRMTLDLIQFLTFGRRPSHQQVLLPTRDRCRDLLAADLLRAIAAAVTFSARADRRSPQCSVGQWALGAHWSLCVLLQRPPSRRKPCSPPAASTVTAACLFTLTRPVFVPLGVRESLRYHLPCAISPRPMRVSF